MGRRNKPRRRPQADKRIRLVGVRRSEIDQRKLGTAVLRLLAIEAGQTPPELARSGPGAPELAAPAKSSVNWLAGAAANE
jgi:hypothetical protein